MPELTVPIPVSMLTAKQAAQLAYLEILTFRAEMSAQMATFNESLDTLGADIQNELQQVRDAVAAAQAAIGDKAALEQALADAQGVIDSAQARVESFSADLKADDPAPEPDPEPAGGEPV